MKRKVLKAISVSLALTCILLATGCDALQNVGGKSEVIVEFKSSDGKQSLSAPDSWNGNPELSPVADIQIANLAQEKYVIVMGLTKESVSEAMALPDAMAITLSDFTTMTKENMMDSITNVTATDVEDVVVNGNKAQYYEMSGEVEKIKVTYIITSVESVDKFYQIIGWTLTPKFEKNKEEIKAVINSFKVE